MNATDPRQEWRTGDTAMLPVTIRRVWKPDDLALGEFAQIEIENLNGTRMTRSFLNVPLESLRATEIGE